LGNGILFQINLDRIQWYHDRCLDFVVVIVVGIAAVNIRMASAAARIVPASSAEVL
jgi:hypothetical protein